MPIATFQSSKCRSLVGVAFALVTSSTIAAEPDPSGTNYRLTIGPEYYAVGTARFNNVASVQAWMLFKRGHIGAIDRCAATSGPRVLAAVERLFPAPGEALELRALPPAASDCTQDRTASNRDESKGFLRDEDYFATDELGRSLVP